MVLPIVMVNASTYLVIIIIAKSVVINVVMVNNANMANVFASMITNRAISFKET